MFKKFINYPKLRVFISEKSDGSMRPGEKSDIINRQNFLKRTGIKDVHLKSAFLENGNNVAIVNRFSSKEINKKDGLITFQDNVFLSITVADCLPIFIYDSSSNMIALLHAGWRGLQKGIIIQAIKKIKKFSKGEIENFIAVIGPGICQKCYEVGKEMKFFFGSYSDCFFEKKGKIFCDLKKIALKKLIASGLKRKNIEVSSECTSCLKDKYFSFRRDKPKKIQAMMVMFGMLPEDKIK